MGNSLAEICGNLVDLAHKYPKKVHTHYLANGLQLHVRFYDGEIHLYISRRNVVPSRVEFATVIERFPGAPKLEPMQQDFGGRHYLYASWKEEVVSVG